MLAEDSGQLLPNNAGKTRSKFIILVATSNNAAAIKPISIIQQNARMCLLTRRNRFIINKKKTQSWISLFTGMLVP